MGREIVVYSPTAILGYGFPRESAEKAARIGVDYVGVDGGSTDPGPYYLGSGENFASYSGMVRDLKVLLEVFGVEGVPLLIGSAGGGGSRRHVELTLKGLAEASDGKRLTVAVIYSDVTPGRLRKLAGEGRIVGPADPGAPEFRLERALNSVVVAQQGLEPFIEALRLWEPDVVVAGRSVDAAPFAAPLVVEGVNRGVAVLAGKILECGALAADPPAGSDGLLAFVGVDYVRLASPSPSRRVTIASVAEHSLYERADPFREVLPGGYADLSRVEYVDLGGEVLARGAFWVEAERYLVKLEGAERVGYRYVMVAGSTDPGFIERLDLIFREVEGEVLRRHPRARLYLRVYGRDGVMGSSTPWKSPLREVGLLLESIAPSREEARDALALARSMLMHWGWRGRKSTGGNLAFPLSPSEAYAGEAYRWSVWHLAELREPLELASIELLELSGGRYTRVEVAGGG
ncbi:MAG: DUF1446 domain-containing protein [Desulfurococcales archaeon]|nr:DUF1446 domain-containing protein [Desulfurococcales archaeon]